MRQYSHLSSTFSRKFAPPSVHIHMSYGRRQYFQVLLTNAPHISRAAVVQVFQRKRLLCEVTTVT